MGINIHLMHEDGGRDCPDWDSSRVYGDWELASILYELEKELRPAPQTLCGFEDAFRPRHPERIAELARERDLPDWTKVRWAKLAGILGDPSWWVWIS